MPRRPQCSPCRRPADPGAACIIPDSGSQRELHSRHCCLLACTAIILAKHEDYACLPVAHFVSESVALMQALFVLERQLRPKSVAYADMWRALAKLLGDRAKPIDDTKVLQQATFQTS